MLLQDVPPVLRFFEGAVSEGVDASPMDHRGETGAPSSVMPALAVFFETPRRSTMLTNHRALVERIEAMPSVRDHVSRDQRERRIGSDGRIYIAQWVDDPRSTGGTPYLQWLAQLIEEPRGWEMA